MYFSYPMGAAIVGGTEDMGTRDDNIIVGMGKLIENYYNRFYNRY